jgi:hypothetical protein
LDGDPGPGPSVAPRPVLVRSGWVRQAPVFRCVIPWYLYPSLLMRQLVRPHSVKVWFEWTAASASSEHVVRRRWCITRIG